MIVILYYKFQANYLSQKIIAHSLPVLQFPFSELSISRYTRVWTISHKITVILIMQLDDLTFLFNYKYLKLPVSGNIIFLSMAHSTGVLNLYSLLVYV